MTIMVGRMVAGRQAGRRGAGAVTESLHLIHTLEAEKIGAGPCLRVGNLKTTPQ